MSSHEVGHDYVHHGSEENSTSDDKRAPPDLREDVEGVARSKREPPPYVSSLSPEQREIAERALVRKIDIRLIPPIIIMYVPLSLISQWY